MSWFASKHAHWFSYKKRKKHESGTMRIILSIPNGLQMVMHGMWWGFSASFCYVPLAKLKQQGSKFRKPGSVPQLSVCVSWTKCSEIWIGYVHLFITP